MGGIHSDCWKSKPSKEKFNTESFQRNISELAAKASLTGDMAEVGFRVIRGPDWMWGDQVCQF